MADDWAAFSPQPAASAPWEAFKPAAAATPDRPSIDTGLETDTASPFVSSPLERGMPSTVPEAFLDRLRRGQAIDRVLGETLKGAQEGFGNEPIAGTDQHLEHLLERLSIERADPTSKASPLQIDMIAAGVLGMKSPAMAPVRGLAMLADIVMRGINAGVVGAGSAIGQLVDEAGGEGAATRKEAINFGNFLMIEGGMGRFSRLKTPLEYEIAKLRQATYGSFEQPVGGLPKPEDFKTAAEILKNGPERLKSATPAAVRYGGETFEGIIHADALSEAAKKYGHDVYANSEHGFVTTRDRFVGREEAEQIASEQDQIAAEDRPFGFRAEHLKREAAPSQEIDLLTGKPFDNTEQHIRDLWEERGIHPAEALHDAQKDAFLRQEITRPFIETYHVSPHDFTEFDPTKIGTGEGAATYGYAPGGYHAENLGTGETYQKTLAGRSDTAAEQLARQSLNSSPDPKEAAQALRDRAAAERKDQFSSISPEEMDRAAGLLESGWRPRDANIYRTRIHADREHFLDWDKPLSEQSPNVQEAVAKLFPEGKTSWGYALKSGEDIVRALGSEMRGGRPITSDPAAASDALLKAGIPGIKYLDRGSRPKADNPTIQRVGDKFSVFDEFGAFMGAFDTLDEAKLHANQSATPTYNFAVFDDKLVELTHKNGIPLRDLPLDQMLEALQAVPEAEGGRPSALGAEATGPLPDLATQPLPKPGRLVAAARGSISDTLGLARNIQFMLDPMSTGSAQAMVIAKDAMNSIRRIDWEWSRRDQHLVDNFDREQRKIMWDRADEESVALQLGESREHQGLVTLDPSERLNVEYDHARAQNAWLNAVDVGMVEGEGLPAYTPRMAVNLANAMDKDGPIALNSVGQNVFTRTAQMRHRKYMTAEETEAAMKAINPEAELVRDIRVLPMATARLEKAIVWRQMINHIEDIGKAAGDELISVGEIPEGSPHKWFTVDNPAFKRVRPKFKEGVVVKDADGEIVFERVPIYVRADFKGPLTSIFDEAPSKHPAAEMSASAYQALMVIKGKSMTVIMNSPLIHNAVVWGKVVPAAPGEWLGFRLYFTGNRIKNDPVRAAELIERGLAPIGRRGSFQDISGVAEQPNLKPGRSLTSDIARLVPDLFDPARPGQTVGGAGDKVAAAIDKAGDFWHNTLLWDRVEDVQFGLAQHLSDGLVQAGSDRIVADRIASHFSNMIVGSIPKEAMSGAARATANMLLFSRSFTLGNLQTFKTATVGLPKPILAQIMRDMGSTAAEMEETLGAGGDYLKGLGRRRAMGTAARTAVAIIAIDYVISKAINSVIQSSVNTVVSDTTVSEEFNGYARRARELADQIKMDPFTLIHPLDMVEKLTPMSENEPQKANRIFIGYDKDGTALYGRNPMGKYPEEMIDWMTGPLDIMRRKMSPFAGGIYEILANDRGFGRKIYDPTAKSYGEKIKNMLLIGEHMVEKHLPMDQLTGLTDLIGGALGKDTGDQRANALRTFAPVAGFTVSGGAPGGMAKGEVYSKRDSDQAKFAIEWPAIRKQFQRGEVEEARKGLAALNVTPRDQRSLERSALNPGRISGPTMQRFLQGATPVQIDRLNRARERAP